jgi:hypothetical protein
MKRFAYLLLLLPASVLSTELSTFSTDGCSAFPEGTIAQQSLWFDCCISHDLAYWKGGSFAQRQQADLELGQCVARLGEPDIAQLMYRGVRIGGTPHIPTPFRWGYGWPFARGYKPLNEEEKQQVREQLQAFQLMVKTITQKVDKELSGVSAEGVNKSPPPP